MLGRGFTLYTSKYQAFPNYICLPGFDNNSNNTLQSAIPHHPRRWKSTRKLQETSIWSSDIYISSIHIFPQPMFHATFAKNNTTESNPSKPPVNPSITPNDAQTPDVDEALHRSARGRLIAVPHFPLGPHWFEKFIYPVRDHKKYPPEPPTKVLGVYNYSVPPSRRPPNTPRKKRRVSREWSLVLPVQQSRRVSTRIGWRCRDRERNTSQRVVRTRRTATRYAVVAVVIFAAGVAGEGRSCGA